MLQYSMYKESIKKPKTKSINYYVFRDYQSTNNLKIIHLIKTKYKAPKNTHTCSYKNSPKGL